MKMRAEAQTAIGGVEETGRRFSWRRWGWSWLWRRPPRCCSSRSA